LDEQTRVIVHGITGREGSFHARAMIDYGTKVVAGVVPRKGGQQVDGIPVFHNAKEAMKETGANTSVIFVPKQTALEAVLDALEAEVPLIVCLSEGIPVHDALKMKDRQKGGKSILVGCAGDGFCFYDRHGDPFLDLSNEAQAPQLIWFY